MEICLVRTDASAQKAGLLLMKSKQDLYPFVWTSIGFAFLLFIVSTAVENLGTLLVQRLWYLLMSAIALLYMFTHTRNMNEYFLYENGLMLRNRMWKKEVFYPFDDLEEARPGRIGKRTRNGMVYHDSLTLRFQDGAEVRFGVGDLEEFYVFRNALLEQIGYFDGKDEG